MAMIFTKELMKQPEVKRFTEIREDKDLLVVEDINEARDWMLALLCMALENPSNQTWLEEFHKRNSGKWKQYYPENED